MHGGKVSKATSLALALAALAAFAGLVCFATIAGTSRHTSELVQGHGAQDWLGSMINSALGVSTPAAAKRQQLARSVRMHNSHQLGVKMNQWPWDGQSKQAVLSKSTIVRALKKAFSDTNGRNPLLKPHSYTRLKSNMPDVAAIRAAKRAKILRAKHGHRMSKLHSHGHDEHAHSDEGHAESEEVSEEAPDNVAEVETDDDEPWGVGRPWNGKNDHCSEDTPNCNQLMRNGLNVYGWPQDAGLAMAVSEQQKLSQILRQTEVQVEKQVRGSAVGGADLEENVAQGLQAASFDMEKLASFQKLHGNHGHDEHHQEEHGADEAETEEAIDDESVQAQSSAPSSSASSGTVFPKWYWTPDASQKVKTSGVNVDQWPWEAGAIRWERQQAQKLRQDAGDFAKLAESDAKLGLFQTLSHEEEHGVEEEEESHGHAESHGHSYAASDAKPCPSYSPNCNKLEDMGVTISRWPLDEAAAKRVWEKRVAQELAFDAKGIDAEVAMEFGAHSKRSSAAQVKHAAGAAIGK